MMISKLNSVIWCHFLWDDKNTKLFPMETVSLINGIVEPHTAIQNYVRVNICSAKCCW